MLNRYEDGQDLEDDKFEEVAIGREEPCERTFPAVLGHKSHIRTRVWKVTNRS